MPSGLTFFMSCQLEIVKIVTEGGPMDCQSCHPRFIMADLQQINGFAFVVFAVFAVFGDISL